MKKTFLKNRACAKYRLFHDARKLIRAKISTIKVNIFLKLPKLTSVLYFMLKLSTKKKRQNEIIDALPQGFLHLSFR